MLRVRDSDAHVRVGTRSQSSVAANNIHTFDAARRKRKWRVADPVQTETYQAQSNDSDAGSLVKPALLDAMELAHEWPLRSASSKTAVWCILSSDVV
jgi:hypothetical protein